MTDDETRRVDLTSSEADSGGPSTGPASEAAETTPAAAETTAAAADSAAAAAGAAGATAGGAGTVADFAAPSAAVRPGSNRARWVLALGAAGLAIAVGVGAFLLLGSRPTPEALRYIPADAAMVAEIRLDLPGDQLQKVGNLLAHFPGFQDQTILRDKIDESLTQLLAGVTDAEVDYRTDIKPWVDGPAFIGVPAPLAGSTDAGDSMPLISATTNGAVNCASALGGGVTHETYRNLDVVIGTGDVVFACVVDGRQALLGEPAAVRAALDAKADGTGMDGNEQYRSARAQLVGDQLAAIYVNGAALQQLMPGPRDRPIPGLPALPGLAPALPAWIVAGIRAEDDALVVDTVAAPLPPVSPGPSQLPLPAGHASLIAPMLPADTLAYVEVQGAGVALQNLLTQLREVPGLSQALLMLDGMGGAGALVGWIDDVGVGLSLNGEAPEAALVLIARDDTSAASTVASLSTMLGLAGLGGGLDVTEETINGVEVTMVKITDLGALVPPGSVPGIGEIPVTGPISFSLAARGRAVVLTFGDGAMAGVLNAGSGASLADDAGFKQAAVRGISNSQVTMYVAVGASLDLLKGFVPPEELAEFEANVAPYLDPVEAVLISGTSDATGFRSRVVITVTTP